MILRLRLPQGVPDTTCLVKVWTRGRRTGWDSRGTRRPARRCLVRQTRHYWRNAATSSYTARTDPLGGDGLASPRLIGPRGATLSRAHPPATAAGVDLFIV